MVNYEVDPGLLRSRVPRGVELDLWNGRCLVSLVGFQFLDTRVLGVPVPFHRDFPEVNLRFYVRRVVGDEVRRAVVFLKEIVPRRALALVANAVYNENYIALPMRTSDTGNRVEYGWSHRGRSFTLGASLDGEPALPPPDAEASFIAEHYWGYVTQRDGGTMEYRVEHPPWRVTRGKDAVFAGDATELYGADFAAILAGKASSSFVAEGSEVLVRRGVRMS